jgi:hypothetical protein
MMGNRDAVPMPYIVARDRPGDERKIARNFRAISYRWRE